MTPQPSKSKNIFGLAVSVVFIVMGYFIIQKAGDNTLATVAAWAAIGFFTIIALFSIVSLVKKSR
jgi:divalent metal cation (Fe/Co/Zn/Cd) transporter